MVFFFGKNSFVGVCGGADHGLIVENTVSGSQGTFGVSISAVSGVGMNIGEKFCEYFDLCYYVYGQLRTRVQHRHMCRLWPLDHPRSSMKCQLAVGIKVLSRRLLARARLVVLAHFVRDLDAAEGSAHKSRKLEFW